MNDKLFKTEDAKVEDIDKLVMDNNTHETKATNTELLLLAKEKNIDENQLELNQSSQYSLEKCSGFNILEVRIRALDENWSNLEYIKIKIEHKSVEVNKELK